MTSTAAAGYEPGVCNIGPAEIALRRRLGDLGLVATVATWIGLLALDAPAMARLLVAVPAAGAASGYLQASLRFCAAYGSRGVSNFGALGKAESVADADARARDRARSLQIGLASAAIGAMIGLAAAVVRR